MSSAENSRCESPGFPNLEIFAQYGSDDESLLSADYISSPSATESEVEKEQEWREKRRAEILDEKKSLEEGEITTEDEYEIEPEDLKRKRAERRSEKAKRKDHKSCVKRKTGPVVDIFSEAKQNRFAAGAPPPFELKCFHEISPYRDYRLRSGNLTKVFFDGVSIPDNYMGKIAPSDTLTKKRVRISSLNEFSLLGKEKKNGFWLEMENQGVDDVILRRCDTNVFLYTIRLERFWVRHNKVFTEKQQREMGVVKDFIPPAPTAVGDIEKHHTPHPCMNVPCAKMQVKARGSKTSKRRRQHHDKKRRQKTR